MVKHFHIDKHIVVEPNGRWICPDCRNHIQHKNIEEVLDCKNIFFKYDENGEMVVVGQCCCYSYEHGKAERTSWGILD